MIGDIQPPPSISNDDQSPLVDKKRTKRQLKKQRYKLIQREKRRTKTQGGDELDKQCELKTKLHDRMTKFQNIRSGSTQRQIQDLKTALVGKNGKIKINSLMDKLGLKDPEIRETVNKLATTGYFKDMSSLVSHIQNVVQK